jgi:hypothetical protein
MSATGMAAEDYTPAKSYPRIQVNPPAPTREAIIRTFPGRLLHVTVLGSHKKRPLSFDSCAPSPPRPAKHARANRPSSAPSPSPEVLTVFPLLVDCLKVRVANASGVKATDAI